MAAELERGDEPEPPVEEAEFGGVETELESLSFPATGPRSSRRSATAKSSRPTGPTLSRSWEFCRANGYPVGNDEWLGV